MQEHKKSYSAYFVTLTYDEDNLVHTDSGPTLYKRHLQLYIKKLRKCHPPIGRRIKYYAVGEYGGRFGRPHYHAIIFNVVSKRSIEKAWSHGAAYIGYDCSNAAIGYTLKYISEPDTKTKYQGIEKPFSVMSKNLGLEYLTQRSVAWHLADLEERMYAPLLDGKKAGLPRYYADRIYSKMEREQIKNFLQVKRIADKLTEYEAEYIQEKTYIKRKRESNDQVVKMVKHRLKQKL